MRRLFLFLYRLFAVVDDDAFVAFSGWSAVEAVGTGGGYTVSGNGADGHGILFLQLDITFSIVVAYCHVLTVKVLYPKVGE